MKKVFLALALISFMSCEKDEDLIPYDDSFMTELCKCGYFQSGAYFINEDYSEIVVVNNCSENVETFRIEGSYSYIKEGDDIYCSTAPW